MRLLSLTVPLLLATLAYAATGGPDGGSTVYTDSDEADGPSHALLDADGGDEHPLDDDELVEVALPFDFEFYGVAYETATISTNGVLFFDGATAAPTGSCPGAATSWTGIAAYWDDFEAGTVVTRTHGVYPWRTFVISWDGLTRAGAPDTGRFQLWLLEGRHEAVVVLDDTDFGDPTYDDGATAVIGTNGADGGLPWSCNTSFAGPVSIWFGAQDARPDRATVETDEIDAPWTGTADFDYAGRAVATGDVNGDGVDELFVGTQDHDAGVVSLIYRPHAGGSLDGADATFTGRATDDEFGAAVLLGDLDGDGQEDLLVGAPGNDTAANRAGAVYLWAGGSHAGELAAADADAGWTGTSTTAAAGSALALGDVDGDGHLDLLVGTPTADLAATDAGAFWLVYGTGALPTGAASLSTADATFLGLAAGDQLGGRLIAADLDDDGAAEIVVSALFTDGAASDIGTVYVLPGGTLAGSGAVDSFGGCSFTGTGAGSRVGGALLAADLDASGLLDLVVGAPTADSAYADAGDAFVFYDPGATCPASVNVADATIAGVRASANLGSALAAGDIDSDGVDELLVAAPNMTLAGSGGGAVYALLAAPSGTVAASDADHVLVGSGSAAALGTALATATDADGGATVVATAPYNSVAYSSEGAVYQWRWRANFLDADGDGYVAVESGGNDCDDSDAAAYPDGTETLGDSVDGDCDGWVDGEVRVRWDADPFDWDVASLGVAETDLYDFESFTDDAAITTYADLTFYGTVYADDRIHGTAAVDALAARVATTGSNAVGIDFGEPVDAISLRVLDPDDTFTITATGPAGTVVSGLELELTAENRTGGLFLGLTFADEVTTLVLDPATADGFGLDDLEVAWAADSDRDGDGYSDADGDCDDDDPAVSPAAEEDMGNGIDDDCDGIVDAGAAIAYTDAAAWAAAANLDLSTTIDFEDLSAGEVVDDQYTDVGVRFDGNLVARTSIDGTTPHGILAGRAGSSVASFTFSEDQSALAFYVLDGDATFTVQAYDNGVLYYTTLFSPSTNDAFYGLVFNLSIDELVITAADDWGLDDIVFTALGQDDADGDGLTERDGDCDDTDASVYPGAEETWYDGVDADCAGDDDYDSDRDGSSVSFDCDDDDATVNPDAEETYYDGVDQDCDGASDYDADGDGHDDVSWGGDDCDDGDAEVSPDAEETWYDGVDQDCDGANDYDADGDGVPIDGVLGLTDCDDDDPTVSPEAEEVWYDGIDQDCSGEEESDYDQDGDGYASTAWGGTDCVDTDPTAYPGASGETCYDGVDQDCDGADDYDCDGDGHVSDAYGGDDCDDADPDVRPGAADVMGDGIDTNCDGGPEYDFDGDGFDGVAWGGEDCEDTDPTIGPHAADTCYDGLDQDCDGWDDYDCDRDGHASDLFGGDDCDDAVGAIHPGATDFPYDGVDQDCGGDSDYDRDGDGHATAFYGGDDCDDGDADVHPGATDACYDGLDADCGGDDDDDCDGDGYAAAGAGGEDCDDGDATAFPGASEVVGDGIDQDCDGEDATTCDDCDGDGFGAGVDCDDTDASVFPGATERWYDGVDQDCDGASDYDQDGDGADAIAWGGGDCDDASPVRTPANTVDGCGDGDEDCDGTTDEDCDRSGDTAPEDTGEPDTDIPFDTGATRDTAAEWRPDGEDPVAPRWESQTGGCGCDAPGTGPGAAVGLALATIALTRRRK